ncbi:hypothetical protein [Pedobacter sp. P26]|uniref:PglD-related sugar-binding protein n=1 Tax=Pedobacter sp. P26 TaxID=3423956 RepID=UPI003D6767DB
MRDIIIYGAGGFGREVHVLLKQINLHGPTFNIMGFVDDNPALEKGEVNGLPVLGNIEFLTGFERRVEVVVALVHPTKNELVDKLKSNPNLIFPNVIHPGIYWDDTNQIGEGNVLCHGMNLTCNIKIGNFNVFNGRVGLGHDVSLGNYNLFGPNSFIAGTVTVGDFNIFAMNSSVIQQKKIGDFNKINLNSVIIRNTGNHGVYFGVPATKQSF